MDLVVSTAGWQHFELNVQYIPSSIGNKLASKGCLCLVAMEIMRVTEKMHNQLKAVGIHQVVILKG